MSFPEVGIIDSGAAGAANLSSCEAIRLDSQGRPQVVPAEPDPLGHGQRVLDLIQHYGQSPRCHMVQVFDASGRTSALQVALALQRLVERGVHLINLSLGLRQERPLLRQACGMAREAGVVLLASMPMRGAPVYPAAWPEVVSVTGDARCADGEWSWLQHPARFGAPPQGGGASLACATFTGCLAAAWARQPTLDGTALLARMEREAARLGPQTREPA